MSAKWITAVIMTLVTALAGCGSTPAGNVQTEERTRGNVSEVSDHYTENVDSGFVYCEYERLSDGEKRLYDELCGMIEAKEGQFVLQNYDSETITKVYKAVVADHPEYFWLSGGYSYTQTAYADRIETVLTPAAADMSLTAAREKELEERVNEIVNGAAGLKKDVDKVLYIHDYLLDATEYDNVTYQLMGGNNENKMFDAATAYGGLVLRSAVCSGYAKSFQLLAQRLGIPCGTVSGEKIGGGSHEWDYIILDGDYYYIDPTWDDPQSVDGGYEYPDNKSYDFFCITSDELMLTHTINDGQFVPECTAQTYDYYRYNGLYFDSYDFDSVSEVIGFGGDLSRMKFGSRDALDDAVADLITNERIFEITDGTSLLYSVGEAGITLQLYIGAQN